MGQLDFLDVNDAKIEELWKNYLRLRGLTSGSDPIPQGESPIQFRNKWEKFLYSQSPTGAAAGYGQSGAGSTGSVVVEPAKNIPDGGFYGDPADALKAGKVVLFEHRDYGGACWAFGPGSKAVFTDEPYLSNDTISSVMVPPGVELILYEHINFQGKVRRITGNVSFLGDEWNDIASSMQIRRVSAQGRRR